MKLYFGPNSPYVRKVMICAHEKGLIDRVELVDVRNVPGAPRDLKDLSSNNPLSKIPTLITDDGEAIHDSLVICVYLESLRDEPVLIPTDRRAQVAVLTRHALANGIMDATVAIVAEGLRPEDKQWGDFTEDQHGKIDRSLAVLETEVSRFEDTIDLSTISVGAMLGYLDLRIPVIGWRDRCPALAEWYEGFSQRASMRATDPLSTH